MWITSRTTQREVLWMWHSLDIALNVSLSSTCTFTDILSTEIEICNPKQNDGRWLCNSDQSWNSSRFLMNDIMMRNEKASLFVWHPRDFFKPRGLSMGNMSTFSVVGDVPILFHFQFCYFFLSTRFLYVKPLDSVSCTILISHCVSSFSFLVT